MGELWDVGGLGQYLNKLSTEEKAIRSTAFHRILDGKRSSIDELAFGTGLTSEQIRNKVSDLVLQGMLVLGKKGAVVGSHGLSLAPTEHCLHINGRELFTWCAVDAVGIPAALNMDALINSECFSCKKPLTIKVSKGEISFASQPDIRVWVIKADLGKSIVGCT